MGWTMTDDDLIRFAAKKLRVEITEYQKREYYEDDDGFCWVDGWWGNGEAFDPFHDWELLRQGIKQVRTQAKQLGITMDLAHYDAEKVDDIPKDFWSAWYQWERVDATTE